MAGFRGSVSSDARSKQWQTAPPISVPRPSQAADAKIAALQQSLANGTKTADSIFREIAEAARILTGATGIALALRTSGLVVCRARSGEIAPEVGTKLDMESGISGQSFRTGEILRCDDTKTDDRVDPGVCGSLGVRSIAVVPLLGREGPFGILEAFSNQPYSFAERQVQLLSRLVGIAVAAYQQEAGEDHPVAPAPKRKLGLRDLFTNSSEEALPSEIFEEPSNDGKRRYWLWAALATLLVLVSAVIWVSWYEPDDEVAPGEQISQTTTEAPSLLLEGLGIEELPQV